MTIDGVSHANRRQPVLLISSAIVSLVVVALLIVSATSAAWTAVETNEGNSWATGKVALELGTAEALFEVTGMLPGDEVSNSITVENVSTTDLDVDLYAADFTSDAHETTDLADHLNVKISTVSAGADELFNGSLSDFADRDAFDVSRAVEIDESQTVTYYFTVELDDATPQDFQEMTATITFVWEGQVAQD